MTDALLNPEEAENYETLGPAYFAAGNVVEKAMAGFTAEHLGPIVKEVTDKLHTSIRDTLEESIWSDVEINLQGKMWRMVDETVKALLSGEEWALKRYALGSRYEAEKVRAAIAGHIPTELQDARLADLKAQNTQLQREIKHLRESR